MRGAGDHAAIPDQHDPLEPEALAQLVHRRAKGLGIGRVARKDFHRHRASIGIGEHAEHDLQERAT